MPSAPPMEKQVEHAIEILKKGGLVAFPTDTVYGLGANSCDEKAVAKVYEAKMRPRHLPLPLLLSHISQMEGLARDIPDLAWLLAERFLPGGLSLVLHKAPSVSSLITAGSEKIALRVPDHHVPIALIEGLGAPIIGTSANVTGAPSPLTAQEAAQQMEDRVDLIIDGGRCPGGVESTVVDLTGDVPRILREGAISRREIDEVCGTQPNEEG